MIRLFSSSVRLNATSHFTFWICLILPSISYAVNDFKLNKTLSVHWLKQNLDDSNLITIDVRPEKEYLENHIPNAINIPVASTFTTSPGTKLVAPISAIRQLFSNAAIQQNSYIVLYDDGNFIDAARVFWILEVYGHEKSVILNGGFASWEKEKFYTTQAISAVKPIPFIPTISPNRMATKLSTRLAVDDNNTVIIDARSADEYNGVSSKFTRKGHIPTAINLPWDVNYHNENGIPEIKQLHTLKSLYSNLDKDKNYITYCNSGRQSALTYFILRQLGFNVAAYDGSWEQWSNDKQLPITEPE